MRLLEVTLDRLAIDIEARTPVVILAPAGLDKVLPIWIGHAEAMAIAMELQGIKHSRPLTHDLLQRIIALLDAEVERVEITELKEATFFAVIHLVVNGQVRTIDARPSDSIALALKTGAQIFVNEELFDQAQLSPESGETPDESDAGPPPLPTDREELRKRLSDMGPEDFGKFSL